jgi:hypothetical protein
MPYGERPPPQSSLDETLSLECPDMLQMIANLLRKFNESNVKERPCF